jgi:2-succinyl-6-hydroxy-2,4-cyclohexadiene-1-carboxylate synthase
MNADPQSTYCPLKDYSYHLQTVGAELLPPVLWLHGFLGSCLDFEPVMLALSQRFYCVGIDLPGHGKTRVLGDESCYGMGAIALSLIQVLDRLNLSPCHLLGYSMGGRVALYLAIHYPQYFRSVILESASPGLATAAERRDRLTQDHAIAHRLQTDTLETFLHHWYHQPLFDSLRHHPSYEAMLQRRRHNDPTELGRSLHQLGLGKQPSLWSKLQDLSLPTQLIVGEQDQKFVQIGWRMAAAANVKLSIIKQCGHCIHQEDPAQYALITGDFLS